MDNDDMEVSAWDLEQTEELADCRVFRVERRPSRNPHMHSIA